jgi:SAM-dependent methyltransferase
MIKTMAKATLRAVGLQVSRIPRGQATPPQAPPSFDPADHVARISEEPLNAQLHVDYASHAEASERLWLAYAELKTAAHLGAASEVVEHARAVQARLPNAMEMSHNQYYRLASIASEVSRLRSSPSDSILDVGGAMGELAAFLPESPYCLADPKTNGISGADLPFEDHSFDFVVSCHVFEHIPRDSRRLFLEQLLAKARRGVVLLNPFHTAGMPDDELLRLYIDVTDAQWAREHAACELPRLAEVVDFAREKGLKVRARPNGAKATSAAFVFVDFFAAHAGMRSEHEELNRFYNGFPAELLDSVAYPNAYLVSLVRSQA